MELGTLVQYGGALVHWYIGTLVRWYVGTLVHWYIGTSVLWYMGICVRPYRFCFRHANGKWQMANGKWQMANGKWQLANGKFRKCTNKFNHGKRDFSPQCKTKPCTFHCTCRHGSTVSMHICTYLRESLGSTFAVSSAS